MSNSRLALNVGTNGYCNPARMRRCLRCDKKTINTESRVLRKKMIFVCQANGKSVFVPENGTKTGMTAQVYTFTTKAKGRATLIFIYRCHTMSTFWLSCSDHCFWSGWRDQACWDQGVLVRDGGGHCSCEYCRACDPSSHPSAGAWPWTSICSYPKKIDLIELFFFYKPIIDIQLRQ